MSLLVVIVNYRTADLTIDCLRSLDRERRSVGAFQVIVVEGGSGDGSGVALQNAILDNGWDGWIKLLVSERNGGFAYANNLAIRLAIEPESGFDVIWLLNPDTYLRPGAIVPLLQMLKLDPRVGIVGSRLEHADGRPQRSAFRFPSIFSEFEEAVRLRVLSWTFRDCLVAPPVSDESMRTDWVSGASMMVRTEVFHEIGLLDEHFFMYYEETDFCRRASNAGWTTLYEPASRVVHLIGQASGVTGEQRTRKRRPDYWFESRRRYFLLHLGRSRTMLGDMAWLTGRLCWYFAQLVRGRPRLGEPPNMWMDFLRHSVLLKGFVLNGADITVSTSEQVQSLSASRTTEGMTSIT